MKEKLTLTEAFFWIVASILFVLTSFFAFQNFFHNHQLKKSEDPNYNITAIVQTGLQKEALHSLYLSELLNLSMDKPTNLLALDVEDGQKKLLRSPLIKEAKIEKIKPGALYIDYSVRSPVAWLYDFENVALDEEGNVFPIYPFLTPKTLPEIYLDVASFDEIGWNHPITSRNMELALSILKFLNQDEFKQAFRLKRIDVSKAFLDSYGKREIVLLIEEELSANKNNGPVLYIFPRILRLGIKNYEKQLGNYLSLRQKMNADYKKQLLSLKETSDTVTFSQRVINLKISDLAFVDQK
ncbi:MAG: hypothetical protein HZB76_02965 [Chlamydiae bacterium]|nr:hypothetical protein [Chlamydiota bacterium]